MEETEQQTPEKSQGSHQPLGSTVMESGDGPLMEPAPVACRNARCPQHEQLVTPEGPRGVCPSCKAALPGSTLARKMPPIDKSKVKALAERFKSDYKVTTQSLITTCEQLATVTERLEKVKPGSVEHQRLFAMWQQLTDRLESTRPEPRASSNSGNVVIFKLPDNGREAENVCDENILREIRGEQRTPGASEPSRPKAVGSDAPAPAETPAPQPEYLVPERIVSDNGRKSEVRMRPVTEAEVEQCMDLQGDLENYRRGLIPRFVAYRQTVNWIKAQFN